MDRYGSDKPDVRFGMELHNVSEVVQGLRLRRIYRRAGERRLVCAVSMPRVRAACRRKKIDALVDLAKGMGAKGLAYVCVGIE